MSANLRVHIHYGGIVAIEGENVSYKGGSIAPSMNLDPYYLTFSLFEMFKKNEEIVGCDVVKLWYRLPNQELSRERCVYEEKDKELMKMCSEAEACGEVHVYIEHSISAVDDCEEAGEKLVTGGGEENLADVAGDHSMIHDGYVDDGVTGDDEWGKSDGEDSEEEEEDRDRDDIENADSSEEDMRDAEGITEANAGIESEDEGQILGEVNNGDDPRFENLFLQAEMGNQTTGEGDGGGDGGQEETRQGDGVEAESRGDGVNVADYDSEVEMDNPPGPDEYPDSPEDTDEEWHNWNTRDGYGRALKGKSVADYDKPPYLWLMQTFNNVDELKDQLLRYVLKTQYDVKLNNWKDYAHAAICTHENCKWRVYCSKQKSLRKWMIMVYENKHNHVPTGRARMLKQSVIAKLFKEEARRRPEIRSTDIKDDLMRNFSISVSIFKCRKARRMALDMVLDTQKQQFAKLWDYEAELQRSNKDITTEIVTVEKNEKQVFESFYICFEPIRRLWKQNCRPLIGLDGAFLKWELKGEILAAVGRDAENRIYPIAWAIVRGENKESWEWFLKKLRDDLQLGLGDGFSFISDKQKGLQIALATVLPNSEHRNCAKHVYGNWKKKFGDLDYKPFF